VDTGGYLHYTNLMIAKLRSHANVTLVANFRYLYGLAQIRYHHHCSYCVSNDVTFGLFREMFMTVDMNIRALDITSTNALLAAVIQSAHPIDARGFSQGGMGQGRVADNLV